MAYFLELKSDFSGLLNVFGILTYRFIVFFALIESTAIEWLICWVIISVHEHLNFSRSGLVFGKELYLGNCSYNIYSASSPVYKHKYKWYESCPNWAFTSRCISFYSYTG